MTIDPFVNKLSLNMILLNSPPDTGRSKEVKTGSKVYLLKSLSLANKSVSAFGLLSNA